MVLTADGTSLRIRTRRCEPALEPAPRDALGVQQIAHVLACYCDLVRILKLGIGGHAIVEQWPRIADDSPLRYRRIRYAAREVESRTSWLAIGSQWRKCSRERIPRDQVESARSGWPKGCAPGVVAHREELRIIPHRGDGVAVVVAHGASGPQHFIVAA